VSFGRRRDRVKIYIVMWQDRHAEPTAKPFRKLDTAKKWARAQAEEFCKFPEDLKEKQIANWLYYVEYSCESDCLWITEEEISEVSIPDELRRIAKTGGGCLCGHDDWCENCTPGSAANEIRKELLKLASKIESQQ